MHGNSLGATVIYRAGPLVLTDSTLVSGFILLLFLLLAWAINAGLRSRQPSRLQIIVEGLLGACEATVRSVAPDHYRAITPFIATLWAYLAVANLVGLIPGLHSPTRDLSVTLALALLVFVAVHWYGIRLQGVRTYLRHYLLPSPILLPFHLMGEISRTIALAVRLFGNIMSMEMITMLLLLIAGLLVPVPLMLLHIVEALVQAYIFGMLALVYLAGSLQSQQLRSNAGALPHE